MEIHIPDEIVPELVEKTISSALTPPMVRKAVKERVQKIVKTRIEAMIDEDAIDLFLSSEKIQAAIFNQLEAEKRYHLTKKAEEDARRAIDDFKERVRDQVHILNIIVSFVVLHNIGVIKGF